MRSVLTRLHRCVGLAIAGFLIVSGLTGAVISWDHELDALLNADLTRSRAAGPALPATRLAAAVEARDARVRVTYLPLAAEPGHALAMFVEPRIDPATGRLYAPGYNQVFLDPATGAELGRREWGSAWPITRQNLVSFLYKLHYSLHIPAMWGIDAWGLWLLGGVALLWTLDCFVGLVLTLPPRRAARPMLAGWGAAWRIKLPASGFRINFDVHRAFGLWTWALLLVLAFTGFSLSLFREVFLPVLSTVSEVTPTPFTTRAPAAPDAPIAPLLDRDQAVVLAQAEAARRGWDAPAGAVSYAQAYGIYSVHFFRPGDDHGAGGVGPAALYFDGHDARLLGDRRPWVGTTADIFVQAQFPLHSGRILGLPGRILISAMGVVVAVLSATGVVIWWRKRAARTGRARRQVARLQAAE